jgi:hypothetical protein
VWRRTVSFVSHSSKGTTILASPLVFFTFTSTLLHLFTLPVLLSCSLLLCQMTDRTKILLLHIELDLREASCTLLVGWGCIIALHSPRVLLCSHCPSSPKNKTIFQRALLFIARFLVDNQSSLQVAQYYTTSSVNECHQLGVY